MLKCILMMMITLKKIELLDSDKMRVDSNKKNQKCKLVHFGTGNKYEYKMSNKKYQKFDDVEIKKQWCLSSKSRIRMNHVNSRKGPFCKEKF